MLVAVGWFCLFILITQTHEYVLTKELHILPTETFLTHLRDKHYLTVILGTVVADLLLSFVSEYIFYGENGLSVMKLFLTFAMTVFATVAVVVTYISQGSILTLLTGITLSILIVTKAIDYQKPKNVKITKF
jgi:hypothetical protein